MKIRTLSKNDVYKSLSMEQAIDTLLQTFENITDQQVEIPDRIMMEWEKNKQNSPLAVFMPAQLTNLNQSGIKIATLVPTNCDRNLPLIHALVILLDINTGQPKAIIEGGALTALKTGAASGVATKLLAKENANSVAIIGCGRQARSQLTAVCAVRPIQKVWLHDHIPSQAEQFAEDTVKDPNITSNITVTDNIKDAVKDADIICTATTSITPIIELDDLKIGAHINAIGGHSSDSREISWDIINQSFVVVEQRAATLRESCEKKFRELGELIQNPKLKNLYNKNFTLFASVGTAALDISIAEAILANANANKIGSIVTL